MSSHDSTYSRSGSKTPQTDTPQQTDNAGEYETAESAHGTKTKGEISELFDSSESLIDPEEVEQKDSTFAITEEQKEGISHEPAIITEK